MRSFNAKQKLIYYLLFCEVLTKAEINIRLDFWVIRKTRERLFRTNEVHNEFRE